MLFFEALFYKNIKKYFELQNRIQWLHISILNYQWSKSLSVSSWTAPKAWQNKPIANVNCLSSYMTILILSLCEPLTCGTLVPPCLVDWGTLWRSPTTVEPSITLTSCRGHVGLRAEGSWITGVTGREGGQLPAVSVYRVNNMWTFLCGRSDLLDLYVHNIFHTPLHTNLVYTLLSQ